MVVKVTEKRLITAALPYVNNIPHLGHIVGSHLPGDIFARFCRLKGYDTLYIGGTDEHGTPALLEAKKQKIPLDKFCTTIYKEHKKIYDWFNISYDNFSRTSKLIHHELTQEFFQKIKDNGYIKEAKIKQFYCEQDKIFLPDRFVEGTCKSCGYEHARGDQCEKCTKILDTLTLINAKCTLCSNTPEIKESNHLFLKYDKLSSKLETWLKKQTHWRPQVLNLALAWVKEGIKERGITRDIENGVKVPLEGFEDKVFYVWFDAPIGYISSTKEHTKNWESYWKEDSKIYHFIGKDNIPFHSIFWPSSLIANGEYNLPYNVVGLQYLNYEGGKFSKTHKRGVFCENIPKTGINPDVLRAYLTFVIPETDDTEFKWSEFESRVNSDLIGNFGNFINRTLTFAHSKLNGEITQPKDLEEYSEFNQQVLEKINKVEELLEKAELRHAFQEILSLSDLGNKFFNDQEPWVVLKQDENKAREILYICSDLCRKLAILSSPYIPQSSEKIFNILNLKENPTKQAIWETSKEIKIPKKHKINKPEVLFEKLTPEFVEEFKKTVAETSDLKDLF
ncbi:methionine--tRNA ligase [Candidatus Woesearchaeota archaeon]|nr:methionine--tRNA ligase [Candidatus Woesearchaeota archaeon]